MFVVACGNQGENTIKNELERIVNWIEVRYTEVRVI